MLCGHQPMNVGLGCRYLSLLLEGSSYLPRLLHNSPYLCDNVNDNGLAAQSYSSPGRLHAPLEHLCTPNQPCRLRKEVWKSWVLLICCATSLTPPALVPHLAQACTSDSLIGWGAVRLPLAVQEAVGNLEEAVGNLEHPPLGFRCVIFWWRKFAGFIVPPPPSSHTGLKPRKNQWRKLTR